MGRRRIRDRRGADRGDQPGAEAVYPSGLTSTTLRPLRSPNLTEPSIKANSVSSPPSPTFLPGWNLVPRWRTRIVPAVILVPSNSLTPRRWALESRPLRVEPPPLVFDIGCSYFFDFDFESAVIDTISTTV